MIVNFLDKIIEGRGLTAYRLARDLGIPSNQVLQWRGTKSKKGNRALRLDYLTLLRQWSGMSWDEFGALLDSEFLPKK